LHRGTTAATPRYYPFEPVAAQQQPNLAQAFQVTPLYAVDNPQVDPYIALRCRESWKRGRYLLARKASFMSVDPYTAFTCLSVPQSVPPKMRLPWWGALLAPVHHAACASGPIHQGIPATASPAVVVSVLVTETTIRPISASTTWHRENNPFADETVVIYRSTGIVTAYQLVPATFPATAVQTEISHLVVAKTGVRADGELGATETWTEDHTSHVTVHFFLPQANDLSRGVTQEDLPCGPCLSPDYRPAPQCDALGLRTACQGQCKEKGGVWRCRQIAFGEYDKGGDFVMGRACWGGNRTEYKQLNTPCVVGDYRIECIPCLGKVYNFTPASWLS